MREFGGSVDFAVPREVAFDYLVDPRHRAEWQASLSRVAEVEGEPRVGQTWIDVTKPGLRPHLRTTELVRPSRWSETGAWRFVAANLTLTFADSPQGCTVEYRFRIRAFGPLGATASWLSAPAVGADVRRAAKILRDRP